MGLEPGESPCHRRGMVGGGHDAGAALQAQIEIRDKPTQPARAIRFANAAGLFYDRGVILSQDGQRIAYRSLDGSITSAYMDRLLTTEEYYDWLAGKPAPSAPQ